MGPGIVWMFLWLIIVLIVGEAISWAKDWVMRKFAKPKDEEPKPKDTP